MVTLILNIVQLFVFGIFSPGVDHLQLYQLLICMFVLLSFEICFEKGAFRQIQDSVMVVLPW